MKKHLIMSTVLLGLSQAADAAPISLPDFVALKRPAPTVELSYGPSQSQGVDLFLPHGAGPHPLVVLIHGGCWSANHPGAGREQLRHLGAELAKDGIAVWSFGYRRANETGGGYPGTYEDVGKALHTLAANSQKYHLDMGRSVLVGHSAGGHLAMWAAAAPGLPAGHALRLPADFQPREVISLAGIGDLQGFTRQIGMFCGDGIAQSLTGVAGPGRTSPYADTSPVAMPAPKVPVVAVSGILDRLIPPYLAHDYQTAMRAKGIDVELVDIPGAGHFDLVASGTPAWQWTRKRIGAVLKK